MPSPEYFSPSTVIFLPFISMRWALPEKSVQLTVQPSMAAGRAGRIYSLPSRRRKPNSASVTAERLTSLLRVMHEAGIEVPESCLVRSVYHNPAATRAVTEQLLALPERPTCIVMPDDYAALGGMEAIRAHGLRIPQDISVAGYDGVPLLQMCQPRLTTVAQDTAAIGAAAARKLVHLIEQPRTTFQETVSIPCRLIAGETVGPAPQGA